jgi:hypothetical protein
VPVMGPGGSVYAAIGVVVPNDGASTHGYAELLRRAATGIARELAAAYRPDVDERTHGIRSLVSGSRRSLEYLESLDTDPHDAGAQVAAGAAEPAAEAGRGPARVL